MDHRETPFESRRIKPPPWSVVPTGTVTGKGKKQKKKSQYRLKERGTSVASFASISFPTVKPSWPSDYTFRYRILTTSHGIHVQNMSNDAIPKSRVIMSSGLVFPIDHLLLSVMMMMNNTNYYLLQTHSVAISHAPLRSSFIILFYFQWWLIWIIRFIFLGFRSWLVLILFLLPFIYLM